VEKIATEGFWKGMPEYTDEEVELAAEFDAAVMRGENPDVEAYLARLPQHRDRLRPILEMTYWLKGEFERIKREYPGFRAWHLIGLPAKCR
jgi:hypothetical protein